VVAVPVRATGVDREPAALMSTATGEDEHAPSSNARINTTANPKVIVGRGVVVAAR